MLSAPPHISGNFFGAGIQETAWNDWLTDWTHGERESTKF